MSSNGLGSLGPSRGALWAGRILTALPVAMLLGSAAGKLNRAPQLVDMLVGKYGFTPEQMRQVGLIELACGVLYAIPQTSAMGAVLTTGYFGGAVLTHLRFDGSVPFSSVMIAVLAWLGLYVRDARVRALLPFRRRS